MFAIVETSGKQYRVEPGAQVVVDHVDAEEGSTIILDRVLLIGDDGVKVGTPTIAGAKVEAKIVDHHLGDKVKGMQYRRRHRMRRWFGFRHSHTTLEIISIQA